MVISLQNLPEKICYGKSYRKTTNWNTNDDQSNSVAGNIK